MRITFASSFRFYFSLYLSSFAYRKNQWKQKQVQKKIKYVSVLFLRKGPELTMRDCEYMRIAKGLPKKIINFFPHVSFVNFLKLSSFSENSKQFSDSIFMNSVLHHFQGAYNMNHINNEFNKEFLNGILAIQPKKMNNSTVFRFQAYEIFQGFQGA